MKKTPWQRPQINISPMVLSVSSTFLLWNTFLYVQNCILCFNLYFIACSSRGKGGKPENTSHNMKQLQNNSSVRLGMEIENTHYINQKSTRMRNKLLGLCARFARTIFHSTYSTALLQHGRRQHEEFAWVAAAFSPATSATLVKPGEQLAQRLCFLGTSNKIPKHPMKNYFKGCYFGPLQCKTMQVAFFPLFLSRQHQSLALGTHFN